MNFSMYVFKVLTARYVETFAKHERELDSITSR